MILSPIETMIFKEILDIDYVFFTLLAGSFRIMNVRSCFVRVRHSIIVWTSFSGSKESNLLCATLAQILNPSKQSLTNLLAVDVVFFSFLNHGHSVC